jgi:hypothetical protein
MMQVIVQQQEKLEEAEAQAIAYKALKSKVDQEESNKLNSVRAKNEAFAQALVETWSRELTQEDLTDETRHNIMALASKYPQETQDFFRVAHHASKKMKERDDMRVKEIEASKNTELKHSFNQVMSKQVHAANASSASSSSGSSGSEAPVSFMATFDKYRNQGSGRDLMDKVLELQQPKRRRMY